MSPDHTRPVSRDAFDWGEGGIWRGIDKRRWGSGEWRPCWVLEGDVAMVLYKSVVSGRRLGDASAYLMTSPRVSCISIITLCRIIL